MRLLFFSFMALLLVVGLLLAPSTSVAQRSIPLTLTRDTNDRARILLTLRRGDRVICDDQDSDAPRCGDEVSLPGPGTYRVDIELTPIGEEARRYVYRLPIARDATAATLGIDVASTAFPDTAWLGSLWLDVARSRDS